MSVKIPYRNTLLSVCCLITIISCTSIENTKWKFRNGFYIGDLIIFKSSHIIKNDTIFSNEIPKAILIEIEQRITDKLLIIKDLNGNALGYYCSK
ncbi:hypothetical protein [Aquimarina sp. I32.4]|uniref:hypothetical protein n=1 Tax=Aquimarina sp. I32.4 TaxID=2053903 RepID=UPI000CDF0AD4|nr:hypothetical protein [Aquimarina sp. I32.4]